MKKIVSFLILILFCLNQTSRAQSTELGIMLGVSGYKGDLNQTMFKPNLVNFAAGVHFRKCINNFWNYKLQINIAKIDAADSLSNDEYQQYRNLSFKSSIQDFSFQFEFNFFGYQAANPLTKFSPYLLCGISIFHFNPKANLNGNWLDLQPLGTEGQGTSLYPDRDKYKRVSWGLAMGGGLKFKMSNRLSMAIEVAARKTRTDYLDDVSTTYADKAAIEAANGTDAKLLSDRSIDQNNENNVDKQRGNANDRDWYYIAGIQFSYVLSSKYYDNCKPFIKKLH